MSREIMDDVRQIVRESPRGMPNSIKSRLGRIFKNAFGMASKWSCGKADDVLLERYNMPEAFSSRPSEARASLGLPTRSASMRENVCIFAVSNTLHYEFIYNVFLLAA